MLEDFGILTEPVSKSKVDYNVREIIAYCKGKNISPENLSKEELKNSKRKSCKFIKDYIKN